MARRFGLGKRRFRHAKRFSKEFVSRGGVRY